MAEGLPPSETSADVVNGFRDSFVDSPSHAPVSSDSPVKTNTNRFSDDFSKNGPDHTPSHSEGGTEDKGNWEDFNLEPDRTETPPNEEEENDGVAESKSLPDLLQETKPEAKKWESFDDDGFKLRKVPSDGINTKKKGFTVDDNEPSLSSGPRLGINTETKATEWTALGDAFNRIDPVDDSDNLPFRRSQSMRADTHRAVRIVDALRQRRFSNTSLDREIQQRFSNEDELTRKFKLSREWDVYLKLNKRIPGTKTKWLPVKVSVKDGVLSVKRGAMPPSGKGRKTQFSPSGVEDIILQHNHKLTDAVPRAYDRQSKVHQIKLQKTAVQERRTIKRFLFVEHVVSSSTLMKFGSQDPSVVQNVSEVINEAIRQLPVLRAKGTAYRINEVFVDVKETSNILMNCDGAVLDRKSLIRVFVQGFLTGAPECKIVLNDIEASLLQGKASLAQGMTKQVRLYDVVLHPCVNADLYKTTREIRFQPVDGSTFELFRCSIDPYISPPINVSCLMEYNQTQHSVRITSSFIVRKKHNLQQRPITDLIIKFPIPSSWSSLFLMESKFGQQRTIGSTASLRGSFRRKIKTRDCQVETHLGSAKYEPEHQAIMWRLGTYANSSQPHTFTCNIQLKPGMQKPDVQSEQAIVTYNVPGSSTGIVIKGLNVEGDSKPETWVKFDIQYNYRVQMFPDLSID